MSRVSASARSFVHHLLPPLVALVALVVVWDVGVRVTGVESYLLPPPAKVWSAFGELQGVVADDIVTTLIEAVLGLILGSAIGVAIALLLWSVGFVRRAVLPLLVVSQTVPVVVLAPLLVMWFGLGLVPKIIVVALMAFFPVVVSTVQGLLSTNHDMLELMRTMGASRLFVARNVLLQSAMPSFFAGLRIAASYAVGAAVVGEWVGATSGLGLLLTRAQRSFRIDRVFVAIGIIAFFSVVLYLIVDQISRLAMPWRRRTQMKGNE